MIGKSQCRPPNLFVRAIKLMGSVNKTWSMETVIAIKQDLQKIAKIIREFTMDLLYNCVILKTFTTNRQL